MLGFGWTDYVSPVWETAAVGNYPHLIWKKDWFTSRYLTLSKTALDGSQYMLTPLSDKVYPIYGQEWSKSFFLCCDSLPDDVEALGIVAQTNSLDSIHDCIVVIEVHDSETDSLLLWHSLSDDCGTFPKGKNILVDAINFSDNFTPKGKTIKTYLWNKGHDQMNLDKMSYYVTQKSRVLTGLYDPLN